MIPLGRHVIMMTVDCSLSSSVMVWGAEEPRNER